MASHMRWLLLEILPLASPCFPVSPRQGPGRNPDKDPEICRVKGPTQSLAIMS